MPHVSGESTAASPQGWVGVDEGCPVSGRAMVANLQPGEPEAAGPARDGAHPVSTVSEVVVVVPAHDEEGLLPRCLGSLAVAAQQVAVPVRVVVVLDSCTDGSAAVLGPGVCGVVVSHRNVGAARAAGFRAAGVGPSTWCACTDADTVVSPTWLQAQLAHAERGVDVLVGTVRTTGWSQHPVGLRAVYESGYTQADGHRHVHGANLGVRGSAYNDLGGFRRLGLHEDVDLVQRAMAAGLVVHRSADPVVHTSTRTSGRAAGGFATHLNTLAAAL